MRLKVTSLVIFVLQCSLLFLHAQKSTYTKDVLRYVQGEALRVIGSFNDTLHVMGLNKNEVTIHLFSANMDVVASKRIVASVGENKNISWAVFKNAYYVLITGNNSGGWQIFKVGASGNYWDATAEIQKAIANSKLVKAAVVSMQNIDRPYLILSAYSEKEKKLYWSLNNLSNDLESANGRVIALDFDEKVHSIGKFLMADDNTVYVIRSYNRGNARFGEFEIIWFDLQTGKSKLTAFSTLEKSFLHPELKYNETDSSLLLWSRLVLRGTESKKQNREQFYYTRMNRALEELGQPRIISVKAKENETNVVLIGNASSTVFSNATQRSSQNFYAIQTTDHFIEPVYFSHPKDMSSERIQNVTQGYKLPGEPVQNWYADAVQLHMRVIWLDENGSLTNNAVLKKRSRKFFSQYNNHFVFNPDSKVYLFYPLHLGGYKQSINYVQLTSTSVSEEQFINVNTAYNHLIHAAQQTGKDCFVIPYTYKNTWGLLKVAF